MSSLATTRSSVSGMSNATSITSQGGERYTIRAPDYDPSALPKLPPKRTREEKEAADMQYAGLRPLRQTKSTPKVAQVAKGTTPPPPSRQAVIPPPALPRRESQVPSNQNQQAIEAPPPRPARAEPPPPPNRHEPAPPPRPRVSALSWGMNKDSGTNSSVQNPRPTPNQDVQSNGAPPPIPMGSKPDLAALQASKPKMNGASAAPSPSKPVEIASGAHLSQILSSSQVVIVDFYADYCGPCKNIAPTYESLCSQCSRPNQVTFCKVNRPAREDLYGQYGVNAMPTFLFFKDGQEIDRMVGASEQGLDYVVKELIRDVKPVPQSLPSSQAAITPNPPPGSCLHCRDFSGPDNHAARFPRESLPSSDLGWLAHQLTAPFPSYTDKARAIFTWLHHNVAYDVVAFFGNNVQPSTPQKTLNTGLAVCEGYAALFTALAVKVGLESVVVGGNGKGYGHSPLQPGQPVPPYSAGHAWNAVKIDNGEWKLIDCCWGAGTVNGPGQPYKKGFAPERFTQSNNDFGLDHFPEDSSKQFRTDGRTMSWEEYILGNKNGCGADFFSGFVAEEGLSSKTFQPVSGKIALAQQGPTVRFAFQKICPHWDPVRCGKGPYYLYVLHLEGLDGTQRNHVPFETNGDVWWCDVPARDLGRPGQKAQIYTVTKFDNKDGRGLTIEEYRRKKGRVGYSFGGVCKWEVA